MSHRLRLALIVSLTVILVQFTFIFLIPLTYDEIFNWTDYSQNGPLFPYFHYLEPNNHLLYSLLSAVTFSASFIKREPLYLRLLNGPMLLIFSLAIALSLSQRKRIFSPCLILLTIAILFASPMSTLYLILARGYLLGTVLLFIGCLLLAQKSSALLAGICVGLATASVPTFGLALPGFIMGMCFEQGGLRERGMNLGRILLGWSIAVLLLYAGTWKQILELGMIKRSDLSVLFETLKYSSWFGWIGGVVVLLFLFGLVGYLVKKRKGACECTERRLALFLTASALAYLCMVIFLAILSPFNLPFPRSSHFIALFAALSLVLVAKDVPKKIQLTVFVLVIGNGMFGVFTSMRIFAFSDPQQFPSLVALSPSPFTHNRTALTEARAVIAETYSIPTACFYASMYGIDCYRITIETDRCDRGTFPTLGKANKVGIQFKNEIQTVCFFPP